VDPHPAFAQAFSKRDRGLLNDRLADRVSRQVVHFSLGRPHSLAAKREWEYDDICRAFKPLIEAMASDINPDRVNPDFVERALAAAQSVPPAPVLFDHRASTESGSSVSVPTQSLVPDGRGTATQSLVPDGRGTAIVRATDPTQTPDRPEH
jgi:hypothetical protein